MRPETKPLLDVTSYPEKEKNKWHRKEIVAGKEEDSFRMIIFSKTYKGYFVDVIILQKGETFSLGARVFDINGKVKLNTFNRKKPLLFEGKNAYQKVMENLMQEMKSVELFAEKILKPQ